MSQKSSKKQKKKADMDPQFDSSPLTTEPQIINNLKNTNGSETSSNGEDLLGFPQDIKYGNGHPSTEDRSPSKDALTKDTPSNQTSKNTPKQTPSKNTHQEESKQENTAQQTSDLENLNNLNILKESDIGDIEPLVLDHEEVDPELEFDDNSDIDSIKGSPIVNRCMTRRSQTRNIPTPKTPKSILESNGQNPEECNSEYHLNAKNATTNSNSNEDSQLNTEAISVEENIPLEAYSNSEALNPELLNSEDINLEAFNSQALNLDALNSVVLNSEALDSEKLGSEYANSDEMDDLLTSSRASEIGSTNSSEKADTDSISNLSTKAVAGGDLTTRDFDLSIETNNIANISDPLINPYRDKTFSDTIRGLSSRRTIRAVSDYRKYAIKTNFDKKGNFDTKGSFIKRDKKGQDKVSEASSDQTDKNNGSCGRLSVEKVSARTKRKNSSDSPEKSKKSKPDSPGLLSYITSPIGNLRSRFVRSDMPRPDVPSSTPKLTGFKNNKQEMFDDSDVSEITVVAEMKKEENKWCSVM